MTLEFETIIREYEKSVIKIILFSVNELKNPLGTEKIVKILRGIKATFIIESDLINLKSFGILSTFSSEQIKIIIEELIKENLLEFQNISTFKDMQVINITTLGEEHLIENIDNSQIMFVDKFIDREVYEFNEKEKELYNILKSLRQYLSKKNSIQAFSICSDSILREIIKNKPKNKDDLIKISGIGQKFIENYGEVFLMEINEWLQNN